MISEKRLLEIYRLYKSDIFFYVLRMTSLREIAEDITHDSFERLIKYSEKYQLEDTNLRSFLYKTAYNLTLNYLKKENRVKKIEIDDAVSDLNGTDISASIELDELNAKIYEFLQGVDPVSRSAFIMKKENGMKLHDIAEHLNISERTVRRRIDSLLEKLLVFLKKSGLMGIFFIIMSIYTL